MAAGLDGLDSLGLLERPDERSLGDPAVDARQFSNLTFFASYARRDQSRAEFVRRVRESRVLVLGASGVGSSVVQCLADLTDGVDIIVGGIDSAQGAHLWVNEAALRAGVPYVGGSMQRTQFVYFSVDPGASPCLLCDESDRPDPAAPTGVAQRLSR